MRRSPHHHRSSNSRERGSKRDYRYSYKEPQDKYYGGQSRKRVHRNDYYEQNPRDNSRRPQDDDNRSKRKQSYEQRPSITIVEKQPYNKSKRPTQPESQIKVHFRFKPIKVKLQPQHEQQIMKLLRSHVSKKQWPVQHFQKSADSRSGYLVIEFGFKYDSDAFAYLKDKFSQIDLTIEKEKHNITAQPTRAFKLLIDDAEEKKKKTGGKSRSGSREDKRGGNKQKSKQRLSKRSGKKHRNSSSRSDSYSSSKSSSSSSRSRRSSRRSKDRRQERQHRKHRRDDERIRSKDRERQRDNKQREIERSQRIRSPQNNGNSRRQVPPSSKFDGLPPSTSTHSLKQPTQSSGSQKKYKTLYFFGIHYSVNLKDMDNLFYSHPQGPFRHQQFIMRRMKNSICEYMQGRFEQKDANKILQICDKLQVKGHPFIAVESDSNEVEKILPRLSQYQVNLQFPQKIEPYYILKWLKQCGRVVQIVTLNKLTQQGLSEYYNITFNSKQICEELKQLRHKEICVQQVTGDNVINVFRPNFKTELVPIDSSSGNSRYDTNTNGGNYQQSSSGNKDKDRSLTNINPDNKDYRSYQRQY